MTDRPRCRCCGKLLRHYTHTKYFRDEAEKRGVTVGPETIWLPAEQMPRTRQEAQRYVNQPIISVKRGWTAETHHLIRSVATWDGETYVGYRIGKDPIFCGVNCAASWGYTAHSKGITHSKHDPKERK